MSTSLGSTISSDVSLSRSSVNWIVELYNFTKGLRGINEFLYTQLQRSVERTSKRNFRLQWFSLTTHNNLNHWTLLKCFFFSYSRKVSHSVQCAMSVKERFWAIGTMTKSTFRFINRCKIYVSNWKTMQNNKFW